MFATGAARFVRDPRALL